MNHKPPSANGSGPGLVADNVSVGYPDHRVIEALSLAVETGKILALVGPNGSGKSTLLKAMARLLPVCLPYAVAGAPSTPASVPSPASHRVEA